MGPRGTKGVDETRVSELIPLTAGDFPLGADVQCTREAVGMEHLLRLLAPDLDDERDVVGAELFCRGAYLPLAARCQSDGRRIRMRIGAWNGCNRLPAILASWRGRPTIVGADTRVETSTRPR